MYHRRDGCSREDADLSGFVAVGHGVEKGRESRAWTVSIAGSSADEANDRQRLGGVTINAAAKILK